MKLDNSGIYYSRMLLFLFGFLVYWKMNQIVAEARIIGVIRLPNNI